MAQRQHSGGFASTRRGNSQAEGQSKRVRIRSRGSFRERPDIENFLTSLNKNLPA